jgi:hypothetical protein
MSESVEETQIELDQRDRDAAKQAIVLNWPSLEPSSPEYLVKLDALARFHHHIGTDRYQLWYNLRPPRDRVEEWLKQFIQGQITESQLRDRYKEHAERPIDLEMLTEFYNAYQENLNHYSGILQNAVLIPRDEGTSAWRTKESAIDQHVAVLKGKLPLWRQNMETVFEFLEELRLSSGAGLVNIGGFEGTSAHWAAQLMFKRISETWESCREVSERSHSDSRYTYAARAIDLFSEECLARFPTPQALHE